LRKIYLKIATRALVVAAVVNEALKRLWAEQAKDMLKGMVENHHYRDAIFLGLQLLSLLLVFEALALAMMWAFNRFRFVRVLVDGIFDVEGSYLETVFVNDELEVVGVNDISFADGELKVDSELHWPRQVSDETITLKKVANTSSLKEMCTASDDVLRYAFGDDYLNPQHDKIGLTVLKLHRSRRPTLLTRLFKKTPIESYVGSFTGHESEIRGRITGRRLEGDELRAADGDDDDARTRLLVAEVQKAIREGTRLRLEPPGVHVAPKPAA